MSRLSKCCVQTVLSRLQLFFSLSLFLLTTCSRDYFGPLNDKTSRQSCILSRLFQLNKGDIITNFSCEHEVIQQSEVNDCSAELQLLQKKAIKEVKVIQKEINEIRQLMYLQQTSKNLTFPTQKVVIVQPDVQNVKDNAENGDDGVDYLAPYLMQVDSKMPLSKVAARSVRDACLRGFKERLIERGNIMQARLDKAKRELFASQETYQAKRGRTLQEKNAFEKLCSDQTFKIKVLETRISLHEQNAISKFKVRCVGVYKVSPFYCECILKLSLFFLVQALESMLDSDDRLKSLH